MPGVWLVCGVQTVCVWDLRKNSPLRGGAREAGPEEGVGGENYQP